MHLSISTFVVFLGNEQKLSLSDRGAELRSCDHLASPTHQISRGNPCGIAAERPIQVFGRDGSAYGRTARVMMIDMTLSVENAGRDDRTRKAANSR